MRTTNYLKLFLVLLLAIGIKASAQVTFNYTGGVQTYTVPVDVRCLTLDIVGATGGQNSNTFTFPPYVIDSAGHGGRVQTILAVTPGQVLNIYVGGKGDLGVYFVAAAGGYNGGGNGDFDPFSPSIPGNAGGGGGGATDIRIGGTALTDRVVVAGGGGGAGARWGYPLTWPGPGSGDLDKGGDGGGTTGEDGWDFGSPGGVYDGWGGTPSSGGLGGLTLGLPYGAGVDGALGIGGDVGSSTAGGGGGGGYYGGGGACYAGGGGGSSYTSPTLCRSTTHTQGYNAEGDGWVVITPFPPIAAITGNVPVCSGNTINLASTTSGGTWSSVTPVVGTINTSGTFGGLSGGTSIVSYTLAGCAVTTTVTVNQSPAAIGGPSSVCTGNTITLTNTLPGGTWSSVTTAVGTISTGGVFAGITPGTSLVNYTMPVTGCLASSTITVNQTPGPITGGNTLCVGTFLPLYNVAAGGTWSSTNLPVATIDAFGVVNGLSIGSTVISYTTLSCGTVTTTVNVSTSLSAVIGPAAACIGTPVTYTCATPGGVWSVSVPTLGTITTGGVFTGVGPGAVNNILYTIGGCYSTTPVTISDSVDQITGPTSVCTGNTISLYENRSGGSWSSSNTTLATVVPSGLFGVVTALSPGVVNITYSHAPCPSKSQTVTVNPTPASITGSTAICVGSGTVLASATPGGLWSSSNPAVTVSPTGVVSSALPGISDTIYYVLPATGCYTMAVVNVGTPPPAIYPRRDSVCQGATTTLYDSLAGGIWSSTSLAIAQIIDTSGVVTGVSAGWVRISYTLSNGCFAVDSFRVKPPLPASVNLTGPIGTICSGDSVTLKAHPINGGTPTYFWKKFSTLTIGGTDDSLKYPPVHGDVIMCHMVTHGICSVRDTVIDTFAMNVYPDSVAPIVVISTLHADSIFYIGEIITFYANVTWSGLYPTYQWYANGTPIAGATSSTLAYPVYRQTTITCSVNGNPPCPALPVLPGLSNAIVIHAAYLGVNDLDDGINLSLFPNPNTGAFSLQGEVKGNNGKAVNYDVTNVLGQIVYKGQAVPANGLIKEQVSLSDVAAGSYIMKVNTENGSQTFHFVISK